MTEEFDAFDVELATKYGLNSAIILEKINDWTNEKTDATVFLDGRYWVVKSRREMTVALPYLSARQIAFATNKLVDAGLVIVGHYSKPPFDRSLWYCLTDNGKKLFQK